MITSCLCSLAIFLGQGGVEINLADSRAGGGVHALGIKTAFFFGFLFGLIVELRVKQGIDVFGGYTEDGFFFRNQPFLHHINRDGDRRERGAFAVAGLEHPQAFVLDGEFHVLHIAVMVSSLSQIFTNWL